jgi:hypothetical protein
MSLTKRSPEIGGLLMALVFAAGCDTLSISNPNAPDRSRALTNPTAVQAVALGGFRTWYLTTQGGFGEDQYPALTLGVMARSHVAAWNNYNIRFYTGCTDAVWDVYTLATNGTCSVEQLGAIYPRVEWQNNPASSQRTQIEAMWYGYYGSLSSANAVLTAIRTNKLVISDTGTTKMIETMAVLTQGLALSGIAINYDKGFIVTYNTNLLSLAFSPRKAVRDSALARFDEAIALLATHTFTLPPAWSGGSKVSYTSVKIAQIANTMAARTLAYYPRDSAENVDVSTGGQVDWARVAGYASKGISSGTPFDLVFHQDGCVNWCDFLKVWSNDNTTMRVHTRIAHLLDPASQPDPWNVAFNTHPNSPDKRLGDGTSRASIAYDTLILNALPDTNCAKPIGCTGGLDYVWTGSNQEIQNPSRGAWHQSALEQVRYDSLATCSDNPQGDATGVVDAAMVLAAENDLIWAEALIREPTQDLATAATLINYTRAGPDRLGRPRGGLTPASAADGTAGLLTELQYEQDVELLGSNPAPFYNQRRINKLEPLTPHEMPVPAKELGVDKQPLYTWGGASNPLNSNPTAPLPSAAALVQNAPQVWAEIERWQRAHLAANALLGGFHR